MSNSTILSIEPVPIPNAPPTDPAPAKAFVLVVTANKNLKKFNLDFKYGFCQTVADLTALENLLKSVANAKKSDYETWKPKYVGEKKMSIASLEYIYLIIRLSDDLDWQFNSNYAPFSKAPIVAGVYTNAKKVNANGTNIDYSVGDGSVVAYLRAKAYQSNYEDHINLNLELLLNKNHGSGIQKLAIIIDPDIGWPNGTKP